MFTSKENQDLVVKLRLEGNNYKQIQDQVGVCKNTIIKILREHNMLKPPPKELTEELLKEIQNRYDECHNIKIVAKEFGISYNRLRDNINIKINHASRKDRERSYYQSVKQRVVDYKGGKCQVCGYNKCITALEFHHLDPSKKDFTISGGTKSFEKLKPEIDKCICVCANCHREIHSGLIDLNNFKN